MALKTKRNTIFPFQSNCFFTFRDWSPIFFRAIDYLTQNNASFISNDIDNYQAILFEASSKRQEIKTTRLHYCFKAIKNADIESKKLLSLERSNIRYFKYTKWTSHETTFNFISIKALQIWHSRTFSILVIRCQCYCIQWHPNQDSMQVSTCFPAVTSESGFNALNASQQQFYCIQWHPNQVLMHSMQVTTSFIAFSDIEYSFNASSASQHQLVS